MAKYGERKDGGDMQPKIRINWPREKVPKESKVIRFETAADIVMMAPEKQLKLWIQQELVRLCRRVGNDPEATKDLLCGANVDVTIEEVEPEFGWRTYEIKARVVTNERVTTCDETKE